MDINFYQITGIKQYAGILKCLVLILFLYPVKLVANSIIVGDCIKSTAKNKFTSHQYSNKTSINNNIIIATSTCEKLSLAHKVLLPNFSLNKLFKNFALPNKNTNSNNISVKYLPSSNAKLSNLNVFVNPSSLYNLSPLFDPSLGFYTLNVINTVSQINIQPIAADAVNAAITVNGISRKSSEIIPFDLDFGSNIFTIKVTAEDGITTNQYVLTISRDLKAYQTISFINKIKDLTYGVSDVDLTSTVASTSGLPIIFTSSDNTVGQIVDNKLHIVGVTAKDSLIITAYSLATSDYFAAIPISEKIFVNKAHQQIIKPVTIPTLLKGDTFDLSGFTSTSGLPVTFNISDTTVADTIKIGIDPFTGAVKKTITKGVLNASQLGTVTLTVNQNGNNNFAAATPVLVDITVEDLQGDNIIVHPAVTPNGDGVNDFLLIEGLSNYKSNSVVIANTYGNLIYSANNYNNNTVRFDGHLNGQYVPSGTYFYFVEYVAVGGEKRHKTGYIVLKY